MIKSVALGEQLVITTRNKVGIMADIASTLANNGVNIDAAMGYEEDKTGKVMLVTSANLAIVSDLKEMKYKSIKETEVLIVELENKPGALKVVTTELKKDGININQIYVTASISPDCGSKMVIRTSNDEEAMALLSKYISSTD